MLAIKQLISSVVEEKTLYSNEIDEEDKPARLVVNGSKWLSRWPLWQVHISLQERQPSLAN